MSRHFPEHVDPELVAELQHYRKLEAAAPHDDVTMKLPEGARFRTEHGAWKVRWRKFQFFVGPLSKDEYETQVALISEPATGQYAHFYSITVTNVTFGPVSGVKSLQVIREVGSKSIRYALQVPGGFAHAAIVKEGMEWDESEWEQLFPTIRMIRNGGASA